MADDERTCSECGFEAKSARGLKLHTNAKHPPQVEGAVFAAATEAVEEADHITAMDAGTVAVLFTLAKTIDGMGQRDPDAPLDNVTIPTFLKYSTELGLTPLARLRFPKREDGSGSKLAQLRQKPQLRAVRGEGEAS